MTIRVGTIVTRFVPEIPDNVDDWGLIIEGYKSCKGYEMYEGEIPDIHRICIGIVANADDDELISVDWLQRCNNHTIKAHTAHVSQLWEIGQIN